jgi:hypothetical protein
VSDWWVVPEGVIGDLINVGLGGNSAEVHVVEAARRPAGAMGPYATQALAQAAANSLNQNIATNVQAAIPEGPTVKAPSIASILEGLKSRALWIRIAEGTLGVALILVGVSKLAEGSPAADLIKKVPVL